MSIPHPPVSRLQALRASPAQRRGLLTLASGALGLGGVLVALLNGPAALIAMLWILAAVIAGSDIAVRAWHSLRARSASIELLVTIAAVGAIAIGEYWEAAAVTFLFLLGGYLEARTIAKTRGALKDLIDLAPTEVTVRRTGPTYGARRVWHDILASGYRCGLHRIERLMREQALRARPRRRGLPKDAGVRSAVAGNVLDRQFQADGPNRKWVADFTYLWTAEGWLYVAAVLDLYSRRIVGWSMQNNMTSQLVADALMMAVWRRGRPRELLHHSDQGSQYTSEHFQRLLAEHGITCSMSRAGEVWDNSAMESFFSSLKTERTARKVYRSREEARSDVFDYIERFYNPTRRHSTLGYVSPIQFELAQEA